MNMETPGSNNSESTEARTKRLTEAADVYRNGMVDNLFSVSEDEAEHSEIIKISQERNLNDTIKLAEDFGARTENAVGEKDMQAVLESLVEGMSEENRQKLKEILG